MPNRHTPLVRCLPLLRTYMGTHHAVCAHIVAERGRVAGGSLSRRFVIYVTYDAMTACEEVHTGSTGSAACLPPRAAAVDLVAARAQRAA